MAEKTYPVQNEFSNEIVHVPERLLGQFRDATEPYTGKPLYRFLSDVPGFQNLPDGGIMQSMVPKDRVHETGENAPFSLPDPGGRLWEVARKQSVERLKGKAAKERDHADILRESIHSTISGVVSGSVGLVSPELGKELSFGAMLNRFGGEGSAEARLRGIQDKPWTHMGGRAVGMVALGALPIPGLGKAAGVVAPSLKGAKNIGSIFELGAAVSTKVRGSVSGASFVAEFKRRFGGSMAFGATVEVPLSLALASADLVDNNKEYTSEAISREFLTQYGFALGLTAVGSAAFSAIGAGVRTAGRPLIAAADEYLEAEARVLLDKPHAKPSEIADSIIRGGIRYTSRKGLRGKYFGLGDMIETQAYKVGRRLVKGGSGKRASETRIGRWLAGNDADDFIRYHRDNQKAIYAISEAKTAGELKEALKVVMHNVDDPVLARDLRHVLDNAEDLIPARRKAADLVLDAEKFADAALASTFRHPKAMRPVGKGVNAYKELTEAFQEAGISKPQLRKKYTLALDDALNLRKTLHHAQRGPVDRAINRAYRVVGKDGQVAEGGVKKLLDQIDRFEFAAREVKGAAQRLKETGADGIGIRSAWEIIGTGDEGIKQPHAFRAQLKSMEGTYRSLTHEGKNAIVDRSPFETGQRPTFVKKGKELIFTIDTRLNDLKGGLNALGVANRVQSQLMADASPLFRAAKPTTQIERLGAQVETVINTKRRIQATLMYIGVKGGAVRHTTMFGGVYLFRDLSSMAEKREAFQAYRDVVVNATATPEALQEHVGNLVGGAAMEDISLGASLASTQATAYSYLRQQVPSSADSMIGPGDFSGSEMENFLEAVGAVMDPISELATAVDGSTSEQGVDAVRAVYPELYTDMVIDVAEFVAEYGPRLGHAQLLGLDAFTGYALGYSDGPAPNLTFQPPYYQTTGAAQSAGAVGGPENRRMNLAQNTTPAQKVGSM